MVWILVVVLAVGWCAAIVSAWSGVGWPDHAGTTDHVDQYGRVTRAKPPAEPDPFEILEMQKRLTAVVAELRVLQSQDADRTYYARAHRIRTRRSAYDQLLAEACRMAGIETEHARREDGICRNEDERFLAEMELMARGWTW
jgi:hypothetical protein